MFMSLKIMKVNAVNVSSFIIVVLIIRFVGKPRFPKLNSQIPKVRLEYAKRSFHFYGARNWNESRDNIQEQESLSRFETFQRAL